MRSARRASQIAAAMGRVGDAPAGCSRCPARGEARRVGSSAHRAALLPGRGRCGPPGSCLYLMWLIKSGGAANSEDGPDVTPGSEPFRGLRFFKAHPFPVVDRGARPGPCCNVGKGAAVRLMRRKCCGRWVLRWVWWAGLPTTHGLASAKPTRAVAIRRRIRALYGNQIRRTCVRRVGPAKSPPRGGASAMRGPLRGCSARLCPGRGCCGPPGWCRFATKAH